MRFRSVILAVLFPLCAWAQDDKDAAQVGDWDANGVSLVNAIDPTVNQVILGVAYFTNSLELTGFGYTGASGDSPRISHSSEMDFSTTTAYTIAVWFYTPSITDGAIYSKFTLYGFSGIMLWTMPGEVRAYVNGGTRASTTLPTSTWVHIVVRWNGSTVELFKNGISVSSGAYAVAPSSTTNNATLFGYFNSGTTQSGAATFRISGIIDQLKLYRRAISDDEIQQLYQSRPQP